MAEFFRTSTVWVVDFHYDGRARRWFKAFGQHDDVPALMTATLHELYGNRARLAGARPATHDEETRYLRDELPTNAYCPTGR